MVAPLDGIKVVELADDIAGAYCGMQLGDAGAQVVSLENRNGSWLRQVGPFIKGESALYMALNRNKESIGVDIEEEGGKEILFRLVRGADVLVHTLRPSEAMKLDITYQRIVQVNHRLIYCSITPFGEQGPYRDRAASELEIQGMSGYLWYMGEPGEAPVRVGADIANATAAMQAFVAILAALYSRANTGHGQKVEVSMLGTLLSTGSIWLGAHYNPDAWAGWMLSGPFDHPETGYQTKDEPIVFTLMSGKGLEEAKKAWERFAKEVGLGGLLEDPYWQEQGSRLLGIGSDAQEMKPVLESAMQNFTAEELVALIDRVGGVGNQIYSYPPLLGEPHPQVAATEMIQEMKHPVAGRIKVTGLPWKLSKTPGHLKSPPPRLAEHTDKVLTRLGYTQTQIDKFRAEEVIA